MRRFPGRRVARLYRIIRRQAARIEKLRKEIRKLKRRLSHDHR
jgi:hypothetical protein